MLAVSGAEYLIAIQHRIQAVERSRESSSWWAWALSLRFMLVRSGLAVLDAKKGVNQMPGYQSTLFETIINVLSELSEDELIELRNRIDFLLEGPAQVNTHWTISRKIMSILMTGLSQALYRRLPIFAVGFLAACGLFILILLVAVLYGGFS
jgi:hypothetical protein